MFRSSWPLVFLLVLAVGGGLLAIASYRRPKGKAEKLDRAIMASLRLGAFAVILFALLRPTLVNSSTVPQRNFVGVLLDDSRSMTLPGADGRPRHSFIEEQLAPESGSLLSALEEKFAVRVFRYSSSSDRVEFASDLTYDGTRTDLVGALDRVREELSSVPLSGVVVISDGADNSGKSLAESIVPLQAASVPVYTVGLGEDALEPDIQ
ncbi:MAG: VWA domain-containing protein, partial [Gemmatimonadetes bacterium]|nr:VWA domain-containing protein [Gemmatimonadota bacterium]